MLAILRNRRVSALRRVLLGTVAALLVLPAAAQAISWTQVPSYYDGGTFVKGKFILSSNASGSAKKLRYKIKSDVIPPTDGLPCTGDEIVCVSTALFNFSGTPTWVDFVTRPGPGPGYAYRYINICMEFPALCVPGVTVIGAFMNFCYMPDPTTLPPPAFTYPMAVTVCPLEGAYTRPLIPFTPPPSPVSPLIIY
ncbi:hypothetical protein L6Q96_09075 [Candidatus Binatia bacterium]|nr:hypothetical protein [Candidatus Binatia bacterium]